MWLVHPISRNNPRLLPTLLGGKGKKKKKKKKRKEENKNKKKSNDNTSNPPSRSPPSLSSLLSPLFPPSPAFPPLLSNPFSIPLSVTSLNNGSVRGNSRRYYVRRTRGICYQGFSGGNRDWMALTECEDIRRGAALPSPVDAHSTNKSHGLAPPRERTC